MSWTVIKQRKHGAPLIYRTMWRDKARQMYERVINGYDDNRNGVFVFKGDQCVEEWPFPSVPEMYPTDWKRS